MIWKIVELPGFEPGSRQSAHKLSTCLVPYWIVGFEFGHVTIRIKPYPLSSQCKIGESFASSLSFYDARCSMYQTSKAKHKSILIPWIKLP